MSNLKVSSFRERFAELFDESDKTVVDLAKDLHVSFQTVSAWKTGTRSPKEPTIIAIADHFGVSVEWLMGFDVEKKAVRKSSKIIIPNTELFIKAVNYMSTEDYMTVMGIYDKAFKKMKELGVIE